MSRDKSWRDVAIEVIASGLLEYEAQCAALSERPDPTAARKYVNEKFYPFTMREYTPYKVWLEELKLIATFYQTGLPVLGYQDWRYRVTKQRRSVSASRNAKPSPGQIDLFEVCIQET